MDERYVSVSEAAVALGVPARTVRSWCAKGTIPSVQGSDGGKRRIPVGRLAETHEWAAVELQRAALLEGW